MNDACKLALFDDLAEQLADLRAENDALKAEVEGFLKRLNTLRWTLECAARLCDGFPAPAEEDPAPKKRKGKA